MSSIDDILEALESKNREISTKINTEEAWESIGTLSILITSYSTFLNHHRKLLEELAEEDYKKHAAHLTQYNRKMNELNALRKKAYNDGEVDLAKANLDQVAYAENVNTQEFGEDDFMSTSTRRLNSYLITAIDSLDSLKKQGKVLDGAREKILGSLKKMGLGDELVEKIADRYSNDKILFMVGFFIVILAFFVLRFILK